VAVLRGLALVRVAIIRNGRLPRQRHDLAPRSQPSYRRGRLMCPELSGQSID